MEIFPFISNKTYKFFMKLMDFYIKKYKNL